MKKILIVLTVLGMAAVLGGLTACSKKTKAATTTKTTEPTTTTAEAVTVTVNVYDIDDELLDTFVIDSTRDDVLLDEIKKVADVVSYVGDYGTTVTSIDGQVIDPNWYVAIYENGEYSQVGVDYLVMNDGDVFDFKVECWNTLESGYGTLDEYDVLLDKAVYHYVKTYMQDMIENCTSFKSSEYWTFASISMMRENGYDKNTFSMKNATNSLLAEMGTVDLSSLENAEWGKYYYAKKAIEDDPDFTDFNVYYQKFLNDTLEEGYSDYATPFTLSPSSYLNLDSERKTALLNTLSADGYFASTEWGIDALGWQFVTASLFQKYDGTILKEKLPLKEEGNAASDAILLMAYAAYNEPVRTESFDMIKNMFDTYYDSTLGLMKYSISDEGINYSTNQIYAGLLAYKANRDLGKAVSVLA